MGNGKNNLPYEERKLKVQLWAFAWNLFCMGIVKMEKQDLGVYISVGQDGELKHVRFDCNSDAEETILRTFLKQNMKRSIREKIRSGRKRKLLSA